MPNFAVQFSENWLHSFGLMQVQLAVRSAAFVYTARGRPKPSPVSGARLFAKTAR